VCGWEIRLTIITCLGGKKCKGLGQTCQLIKSSFYNKGCVDDIWNFIIKLRSALYILIVKQHASSSSWKFVLVEAFFYYYGWIKDIVSNKYGFSWVDNMTLSRLSES